MTYLNKEDEQGTLLPDAVIRARVEQMVPGFAAAVKEAAQTKAAMAVPYSRITNTATPLEEVDCTITGMLVNYARLHGVLLMISPPKILEDAVTNHEAKKSQQNA